mmetsp:Transcript_4153/g.9725  ORF Transcript_4153/g.9725 Transcript_4153/m.9725 type:complete len:101 (-) Transcript_4153:4906-5208(-)
MSKTTSNNTPASDIFPCIERPLGTLNVSPLPKAASKASPRRHPRHEKRVSIDLIPTTLEEIEWAMQDAKIQEEEREIQEIRERLRKRKQEKAAAAAMSKQ